MDKVKVGIIGCGTIGSSLAGWVVKRFSRHARVAFLSDRNLPQAVRLRGHLGGRISIVPWPELIRRSDVIVEAASSAVSARIAEEALRRHKKILVMSAGGLLGFHRLGKILGHTRGRLWVPSGAIAGVDGLAAAREGKIRRVVLITRKPPRGLKDAPYFRKRNFPRLRGRREVLVFRGPAARAVREFPQNINVAAVLSLAGIGPRRTQVEIWTSRAYRRNQHEVLVEGDFGRLKAVTSNVPAPGNPKTSTLAVLSAAAVLREIFSSVEIGT